MNIPIAGVSQETNQLNRRYFLLSFLFGIPIGLRLTTDVRAFEWIAVNPHGGSHFLMALTMGGMLAGEIAGKWVSQKWNERTGVYLASSLFMTSAICGACAVGPSTYLTTPFYYAALSFGLGHGLMHSCFDSWLTIATANATGQEPTDAVSGWGWTCYTAGFLFGTLIAFPLLYGFKMEALLNRDDLTMLPYGLSLFASIGTIIWGPNGCSLKVPLAVSKPGPVQAHRSWRNYRAVIHKGGVRLVLMICVGGIVSFEIMHVDTFGSSKLLQANTVREMVVDLAMLHVPSFLVLIIFATILTRSKSLERLGPRVRALVIASGLCPGLICLLVAVALKSHLVSALVLGVGYAFLNALPQVVKWGLLGQIDPEQAASAYSLLGIMKRLPNLLLSLFLFYTGTNLSSIALYVLLASLLVLALSMLWAFYFISPPMRRQANP